MMISEYPPATMHRESLPPARGPADGIAWPPNWRSTPPRERWFARFATLEPGLSLSEIAGRLGTSYTAAFRWANAFRYRYRITNTRVDDWGQVDWRLSDAEIARRVRVSRERVRQVRSRYELPPSRQRGFRQSAGKVNV